MSDSNSQFTKSLEGQLLVAAPSLQSPPFHHAVILLMEHGPEGALGVVLNRPIQETVSELWKKVGSTPPKSDRLVHFGGPVSGPLLALHLSPKLGEKRVPPGVYLAAARDHLERLVRQDKIPFRLFVGHAGWTGGQLENELAQGVWMTLPARPEHVFADEQNLWKSTLQQIGWSVINGAGEIKHQPADVRWN